MNTAPLFHIFCGFYNKFEIDLYASKKYQIKNHYYSRFIKHINIAAKAELP